MVFGVERVSIKGTEVQSITEHSPRFTRFDFGLRVNTTLEMNGDRLLIDRSGPGGSINMRVVLANTIPDKTCEWSLKAPMPPCRPTTLSEELKARRLARHVDKVDPELYTHICDFVWSQCDVDDSVDATALEKDLRRYLIKTSASYDGLGDRSELE